MFIRDKEEIARHIGSSVYFGEVLRKHSEIFGELEESDLTIISEDQDFIKKCKEVFDTETYISGYDPLDWLQDEEDEEDEDEDEEGYWPQVY